jgi:chromosome segregation ATPase
MNKRFTPEQLDVIQWEFDRHVAAANARTKELEQMYEIVRRSLRVEKAELVEVATERDQLADRVKELERKERDLRDGAEFLSKELGQANGRADQLSNRVRELEMELCALNLDTERLRLDKRIPLETK